MLMGGTGARLEIPSSIYTLLPESTINLGSRKGGRGGKVGKTRQTCLHRWSDSSADY